MQTPKHVCYIYKTHKHTHNVSTMKVRTYLFCGITRPKHCIAAEATQIYVEQMIRIQMAYKSTNLDENTTQKQAYSP